MTDEAQSRSVLAYETPVLRPRHNVWTWLGCVGSLLSVAVASAMWGWIWKNGGSGQVGIIPGVSCYMCPIAAFLLSGIGWYRGARFGATLGISVDMLALASMVLIASRMW